MNGDSIKIKCKDYKQFATIRKALEVYKAKEWDNWVAPISNFNKLPFEDIKELRRGFDNNRNPHHTFGVINSILDQCNEIEIKLQKELGMIK